MLRKLRHRLKIYSQKAAFKYADFAGKNKLGKRKELSLSDIYFMQFMKAEQTRYDMVVRYLAVEHYYEQNAYGWDLYRKMQDARIKAGYSQTAEEKFRILLDSYKKNGYSEDSYIIVDKNLLLVDGSHRMAIHMYHGISKIKALVLPISCPVDYTIDWFFQNGFTDEEIDIILKKEKELTERLNTPFSCVIWSPAVRYMEAIIKDLSYFGTVCGYKKYDYRQAEYENVVKAIYAVDDIAKWKIEKKLEHMCNDLPSLVAVDLRLDFPDFRVKDVSGMPLSRTGERIKKSLRTKFQAYIEDYFFDVILHIADNHLQSDYMRHVFEPGIDFQKMLAVFNNYQYAFAKTASPYYPEDFPGSIPVGKDVDVLCLKCDYEALVEELIKDSEKYQDYEIRCIKEENGTRIRYEKLGHLILQIDIAHQLTDFSEDFVERIIEEREPHGEYYRLSVKCEYLYRLISYCRNRTKNHHYEYLKAHRSDFDAAYLNRYCKTDVSEVLRKLGI